MKALLITAVIILSAYFAFLCWLVATSHKTAARAIAGLIPDCVVLFKNLLKDRRVPSRYKLLLVLLVAYLLLPIDIVPDFIPAVGQLDDAIIVVLIFRHILKGAGSQTVKDNWRGPEGTLRSIYKVARIDYP